MEKEQLFEKRILDLAYDTYYKNKKNCSYFMDLEEIHLLQILQSKLPPVSYQLWGGCENAERKIVCFYPEYLIPSFPIVCVKIKPSNLKFSEELTHRDFLGSILNLGIERNRIGDIVIQENIGFVFCYQTIFEFLIDSLFRIKHTHVVCEKLEEKEMKKIELKFDEITGTVAGIRLDSVLSVALHASRSRLSQLILSGMVFVNGKSVLSNGYHLKEGDILSVRGFGKFIYQKVTGQTRKGRYAITILKYK